MDGYGSDTSWTAHSDGRIVYAPRTDPKWKFLDETFKRLRGRCSLSDEARLDTHAVRIGREMHDWWIDVLVENGSTSGYLGARRYRTVTHEERATKLRSVGEAVRLMTVLSRVDYKSWIGKFIRKTEFKAPKFIEMMTLPKLQRNFCFFFNNSLKTLYYQWDLLENLLAPNEFTDEYKANLTKICELAEVDGKRLPADLFAPIPMRIVIEPCGSGKLDGELNKLRGIIQTVKELLSTEQEFSGRDVSGDRLHFHVESIELNLRSLSLHPVILDAIRELVETGVRVRSLALPQKEDHEISDPSALRLTWSELCATICGYRPLPNGSLVRVDSIQLPSVYTSAPFFVSFCSALSATQTVERVHIELYSLDEEPEESCRIALTWLGYALFRKDPCNSVDTVQVGCMKLTRASFEALERVTRESDAIGALFEQTTTLTPLPQHQRQLVLVAKGASVTQIGVREIVSSISLREVVSGHVLRLEPESLSCYVYIPGLGFCRVEQEFVTPAADPCATNSIKKPLGTFVLKNSSMRSVPTREFLAQLLQLIGTSLTSLALESRELNDESIRDALRIFPRLQSLRIRGARLQSLEPIISEYERRPNFRLSSLELRDLRIPIAAFHVFIEKLTPRSGDHEMQRKLQRLRVGGGWSRHFTAATGKHMRQMYYSNEYLSHIHVFEPFRDQDIEDDSDDDGIFIDEEDSESEGGEILGVNDTGDNVANDGEDRVDEDGGGSYVCVDEYSGTEMIVPGDPVPLECRFAFLSVLHQKGQSKAPKSQLATDVLSLIFNFAADTTWRCAVWEPDVQRWN